MTINHYVYEKNLKNGTISFTDYHISKWESKGATYLRLVCLDNKSASPNKQIPIAFVRGNNTEFFDSKRKAKYFISNVALFLKDSI